MTIDNTPSNGDDAAWKRAIVEAIKDLRKRVEILESRS